jgi:hypothetical protein
MADDPEVFSRYCAALEPPTSAVIRCAPGDRYEIVGRLMNAIAELIGSDDEWHHAGRHYTLWAEIHDLVDLHADPETFDAVARTSAETWLSQRGDEARHVEWLTERQAWLAGYAASPETSG